METEENLKLLSGRPGLQLQEKGRGRSSVLGPVKAFQKQRRGKKKAFPRTKKSHEGKVRKGGGGGKGQGGKLEGTKNATTWGEAVKN